MDPFNKSPISQVGLSQAPLGPWRVPNNPPTPYPTRCKSRYRFRLHNNRPGLSKPPTNPSDHLGAPRQSSWTTRTLLPDQGGHPPTHPIPYPTLHKSRYRYEPPQQSPWTIPIPLSAHQPNHPLPNPVEIPAPSRTPSTIVLDHLNAPPSPKGTPTNHNTLYPTRYKSQYRPGPPQKGETTNPPTPYPILYKSR